MRKGKILLACLLVLGLAGAAWGDVEVVKTGFGSMSVAANFQAGFNWYVGNELLGEGADPATGDPVPQAVDRPSDMEFYLKRVRLAFKGDIVSDKVKYMIQFEGAGQDGVQLVDVMLGFKYIPYTTIWVGKFLPHFQYWTPLHTGQLQLIDYPLAYQYFGVQRHIGLDIAFNHKYVDINLAVNNGHDYNAMAGYLNPADRQGAALGNQTWTEENTAKDIYFNIDGKPIDDMHIVAGIWYGTPLDYFENDEGENIEHNGTMMAINAGFIYNPTWGLRFSGEVFYSTLDYDSQYVDANGDLVDREDDTYSLTGMGFYVRAGYNIETVSGVPLEFLVQYDQLDPDTMNDEKKHGKDDELMQVTGGMNYYIMDWHAMIYLNYIYKQEAWKDVLNLAGDDTQDGIKNDELKLLFQVAF